MHTYIYRERVGEVLLTFFVGVRVTVNGNFLYLKWKQNSDFTFGIQKLPYVLFFKRIKFTIHARPS